MFCFGTEIGTENRGFSLVLVPNTEILVPWQHYTLQLEKCIWKKLNMNSYFEECLFILFVTFFSNPLQWMGAIRMEAQTADKNISIIHTTTVHKLTS